MKPKTIETARWGLHPVQVLENSLLSERSGRVFLGSASWRFSLLFFILKIAIAVAVQGGVRVVVDFFLEGEIYGSMRRDANNMREDDW